MPHGEMLNALMDKLDRSASYKEVWDALYAYVQHFEINGMTYYHLAPPGSLDFTEKYFVAFGFDEKKVAEYRRQHSIFKSPLTDRSRPLTNPVFWNELMDMIDLRSDEEMLMRNFYCAEPSNGIAIPTYGPNSRNGCVVLRFNDMSVRFKGDAIRAVQWAAHCAHLAFCKIRAENLPPTVSLTHREQEVLTWVARGKSNTVIADIVGISQHTVNGYLRRIYLKTGTSDRTTATLRALGESLIDI